MSRPLRYVPPGGGLFEVLCRYFQGRALLRPSREVNRMIVGTLARGIRRCGVRLVAVSVLSNHMHLLVLVDDARQLARLMEFVNANIARQVGRLQRWDGKFWDGRYRAIPISNEEAAQVSRLKYLLEQGCKEGLVARPQEWPGVHCAQAMASGEPLQGRWFDATGFYRACLRRGEARRAEYEQQELLELTPLPCWAHLPPGEYRGKVFRMIEDIATETRARHRRSGTRPLGRRGVLRRHPHRRGPELRRTPAPWIHAVHKSIRAAYRRAYREFVLVYRAAAAELREGNLGARFPPGCFPPALPFVPAVSNLP